MVADSSIANKRSDNWIMNCGLCKGSKMCRIDLSLQDAY
jgi:hypothetical protein